MAGGLYSGDGTTVEEDKGAGGNAGNILNATECSLQNGHFYIM